MLTTLEKAALITTGAAAAWKILLWQLGYSVSSTGPLWWGTDVLAVLRVCFALLSFVSFDLVLVALVIDARRTGASISGGIAAGVAAVVSALIALEVAKVFSVPALHAAPMLTLLAYTAHLMWSSHPNTAVVVVPAAAPEPTPQTTAVAAAQVAIHNHIAPQLPRTVPDYIAARAVELGNLSAPRLATELATSPDTIRRALALKQIEEVA